VDNTYKKFAYSMRLDTYLVREKHFASRSRAQQAIKRGFVVVNHKAILKPSFDVTSRHLVAVASSVDKPAGYWKLKEIQQVFELIKTGDVVLDIGAGAGGFLSFAAEIASLVYAVEFSRSCKQLLDTVIKCYPSNAQVTYADAFSFDFRKFGIIFDVILCDITGDPKDSLQILAKASTVLTLNGRVLQVLKGKADEQDIEELKAGIQARGYEPLRVLTGRKNELYIIARKVAESKNAEEGI
jgi:23S rRNA (cytidine1920-2'-O)/16S rRNA (cytidine1409-2'-O)-methyltransferase